MGNENTKDDQTAAREASLSAPAGSACAGCRHSGNGEGSDYCYMFRDAPENLPCGQHDKFAEERSGMGSLVRRRPEILAMIIGGISN
jgi:hypothetical protein